MRELEARTESTGVHGKENEQRKKRKEKTTSKSAATVEEVVQPPEPAPRDRAEPTFAVGKRAFKVFSALFYSPNTQDPPGEIPWIDFLSAMSSVNFAVQKLYGSVWQFTPTTLDVESSIQFHEPHPTPKLGLWMAGRMGEAAQ